jgi:hypothetical protein
MKNNFNIITSRVIILIVSLASCIGASSQISFQWRKEFGSDKEEYVMNHLVDSKGNIYIRGKTTGNIAGPNSGKNDGFVVKTDNSGNKIWAKQFGTSANDGIRSIASNDKFPDKIFISGLIHLPPANAFIGMFTKDGEALWKKHVIEDGRDGDASGKDVSIDSMGNIYHVGLTHSNLFGGTNAGHGFFIVKYRLN